MVGHKLKGGAMAIYKRIPLEDLEINPANDRHGDLLSEDAAIEWLLVNKTEKMKDLLQNIVDKERVFEEPLVRKKPNSNKYSVYDGNRRVTCLKLLHGMVTGEISNPLEKKIQSLLANSDLDIEKHVECRVEEDINTINEILELRHTPGNSGAGRLKWDGHEKENFLERTGRSQKINFAREINQTLIDKGYLNSQDRIPLSTFNRLFSSKDMRKRAGVEITNNKVHLINHQDTSYKALTRIAKDMIAGKKTLDDVWSNQKKMAYLDELEKEGVLPSAEDRLDEPEPINEDAEVEEVDAEASKKKPQAPQQRDYLLATNLPTPELNGIFSSKFCQLFYELQNTLRLSQHPVTISITFRAFLELLTNSYIKVHSLSEKGSLPVKVKAAFAHMQASTMMPEETRAFIVKLDDANEYFSINTLHKVTHHNLQISENDLRAYVNNLDAYFREAITSINASGKIDVDVLMEALAR